MAIGDITKAVASGAAAVGNSARTLAGTLKLVSRSADADNAIANPRYLRKTAASFDIETLDRTKNEVASDLADYLLAQLSWPDHPSGTLDIAPQKQRELWKSLGIEPSGVDSAVLEAGNPSADNALACLKCGVAEGWVGSLALVIASDILNGSPKPYRSRVSLAALSESSCGQVADVIRDGIDGPDVPDAVELIAGFSNDAIMHMLGGRFRGSFRVLNDAIIDGRIRGIACVSGRDSDGTKAQLVAELIKRNVLVLHTGYSIAGLAKAGLLLPEAALDIAGETLREVCEMTGMPPVLQMGSCSESIRPLLAASEILAEGGLGESFSDMPIAAACGLHGESGAAIASCYIASGVFTAISGTNDEQDKPLFEKMGEITSSGVKVESDPLKAADAILAHIEDKRDALNINQQRERKLVDMKERRELV